MISGFELDRDFTNQRVNSNRKLIDLELGITMPKQGVFENVIVAKKFFLEVVELAPVTPKHVLEIRKKKFCRTILSYFFS